MTPPLGPPKPLRFRRDLRVTPRVTSGKREFLIEDKTAGRFHLLGAAEYFLASSCNGLRSLPEVTEAARQKMDDFDLHPPEVAALARWLLAAQIVDMPGARAPEPPKPSQLSKLTGGVLYFRLPFGSPDNWIKPLVPFVGWLFTWPTFFAVLAFSLIATAIIVLDSAAFTSSFSDILAPDHQWRMLLVWVFLKAIHEGGHAIACRRFGGEVRDCGVAFFFLAPAPYVDVTSCWRFPSRWERMVVALAGMYVELLAAIVAVFVWRFSPDPVTRQLCVNVISLATITTVLFNANPLMKYDGYFALSDLLQWPNLASDGKACVMRVLQRHLLGTATHVTGAESKPAGAPANLMARRPTIALFLYGLGSTLWQSATMLGLALFAIAVYEGIGIVIALVIGLPMIVGPMTKIGSWLLQPDVSLKSRLRAIALTAAGFAIVAWTSITLPWPEKMRSAGVVEFSEVAVVRAVSPGNVARLHVADGQFVQQGELVATLENAELVTKAQLAATDATLSEMRARGLLHQQRLSDYRAEGALSDSQLHTLQEGQRQVEALQILAPISGMIMGRKIEDREGVYLKEGEELCKVAQGRVEIRLSVPQQDMDRFQSRIGKIVSVRLPSGTLEGKIVSLDPMGSLSAVDPALLAPMGGPLAARAKSADDEAGSDAWKLPEPHFLAKVEVDNERLPQGFAGQRAEVSFLAWDRTIARQISDYFATRFQQAQATQTQ